MRNGKHAYLILAHDRFGQLEKLLSCLDHPRNDIFLHIDRKVQFDAGALHKAVQKAGLYFTQRVCVAWGGYSIVQATLLLLEAATERGEYDYYHLLSGSDLPLQSQEQIHAFFDAHQGKEFISMSLADISDHPEYTGRIRYYHWFQERLGRSGLFGKLLRRGNMLCQRLVGVNRLRGSAMRFGVGSQFFSITDAFARYTLERKEEIHRCFRAGFCVDELFLQTVYLSSPFAEQNRRYISQAEAHPYIQKAYMDVVRAIDWERGAPYTYREEDFHMLITSGCLFARKFDEAADGQIVQKIVSHIQKENEK